MSMIGSFEMPPRLRSAALMLMVIGAIGFAIGILASPETVGVYLLLLGFLGVGLGLAGALFVALEYVTGASWSVALRRVPEAMVACLPVGGFLLLVALFAFPSLYPWNEPEVHLHGELKHAWLQRPFFLGRAVGYLLIWIGSAYGLVRTSRQQDSDPASDLSVANQRWSALFLVSFAITFWLASYDWLMSREPNWVSTVYGLYNFAGVFTSGLAVYILLVLWLRKRSPFREIVADRHLHDLGKLLFAMCVFWMYLWYCQYMLIWFVNNPEETPHYLRRTQGFLATLFYVNVALNGVIPFLVLLPRAMKQNPKVLVNICVLVLGGRWLDLYLLILPDDHGLLAGGIALAMTIGAAGAYFLIVCRALAQAPLVPRNDPYSPAGLAAHGSHLADPGTAPAAVHGGGP
jgi:hypothetical protein